jgi:hypothetical protein
VRDSFRDILPNHSLTVSFRPSEKDVEEDIIEISKSIKNILVEPKPLKTGLEESGTNLDDLLRERYHLQKTALLKRF